MNTSRKLLIAGATALAAAAIASTASAQASASTPGTASVNVLQPIQIAAGTSSTLSFGTVVQSAGTVTIDPTTGTRTASGVTLVTSNAGGRADFKITGEGGQNISVTVPPTVSMAGPGTNNNLTVNLTTTTPLPTSLSGTLGTTGTATFGVGGNVTIAANTPNGAYSGTFDVVAAYN